MLEDRSIEYETLLTLVEKLENDKKLLKERIESYNLLFDNSPLGVLIFNDRGNIIDINKNLLKILGSKSESETKKINMLDYYAFKTLGLNNKIKEAISTENMISGTLFYKTKWKKEVNLRYSMKAVKYRENKIIVAIIEDITYEKEVEILLHEELKKFKKLLEFDKFLQATINLNLIIDTILVTATAGDGFSYNRAFLLLVDNSGFLKGVSAIGPANKQDAGRIYQEIEDKHFSLIEIIDNYHSKRDNLDQVVKSIVNKIYIDLNYDSFFRELFHNQRVIRSKDDNLYPDSYITNLLDNDDLTFIPMVMNDKPIGVLIVDNYITGKKVDKEKLKLIQLYANRAASAIHKAQLHEKLNQEIKKTKSTNNKLMEVNNKLLQFEKMAAIGEVTSEIAHEIRNPLVSIGGFANVLSEKLSQDDENYELIRVIVTETQRLENILNNVLNYARINNYEPVYRPICDSINEAIKLLEYQKVEKELDIILITDDSKIAITYDYEKFIQVFFNLIKNAMQASQKGDKIEIIVKKIEKNIVIRIKDHGTGIKEDNLDSVFNPFFTTKSNGIGLGLSIVKQIINNHNGDIFFITEENNGTEFIITLKERRDS